jgi:serine/threonine protein kinase
VTEVRWDRLKELVYEALQKPSGERARFLDDACSDDPKLRAEVEGLLGVEAGIEDSFFGALPIDARDDAGLQEGEVVAERFRLVRKLGEGGMGQVWLAEQTAPVRRSVALKLIKAGMYDESVVQRFRSERQSLAIMDHPGIAKVFEAGATPQGQPFFVMEYVPGVPITEYCDAHTLSIRERLSLFIQACEGVQHAHQKAIIHRDLKPANILVIEVDGKPVPRIIDFGLAKQIRVETERPDETMLTRFGQFMGTPGYISPEQVDPEIRDIDTRSDLYSLGVILYVLLTGLQPFENQRRQRVPLDQWVRTLREEDPPVASAKIAAFREHAVLAAAARATTPLALSKMLRGDLDCITQKALDRDRERRYPTPLDLAADLKRHLNDEPISALPSTTTTLAWKFVRRHSIGTAMTAALLALIIAGSAGIAWQAARAEREAQRATAIKDFLVGMFRANDPQLVSDKPRGEISIHAFLDASTKQIQSSFARQPSTQIELLGVTADIYRELEETQQSNALYARETELARRVYGEADSHVIEGLLGQADVADNDGDDVRALALLSRADPLIRAAHLDRSSIRARWLLIRGESLFGDARKADEARTSLEASVTLFEATEPLDSRYVDALIDLGSLSLEQSQFTASADYYRRAIAIAKANPQLEGDLVNPYAGLALAAKHLGDFAGAAAAFASGTEVAERTSGRETQSYWGIASDWALFRYERGEREEALKAFAALQQNLPSIRAAFRNATDAMEAAHVLRKYGHCLAIDGQGERAVALLEQARALLMRSATHPFDTGELQLDLGSAYQAADRVPQARAAFTSALTEWRARRAPAAKIASALERWGRFLTSRGDQTGAAAAFSEALQLSAGHATEAAVRSIAGLAAIAVLSRDAQTALAASSSAIERLGHLEGSYDIRIEPYVWTIRANSLLLAGERDAADALALKARNANALYYSPSADVL